MDDVCKKGISAFEMSCQISLLASCLMHCSGGVKSFMSPGGETSVRNRSICCLFSVPVSVSSCLSDTCFSII